MTIDVTLSNLVNLQNETSAVNTINANSAAIEAGFTTALNVAGDQMSGTLNMNSNQIINLPAPATPNSPARLVDVTSGVSAILTITTVTALPAGVTGAVGMVQDATATTFASTVTGGGSNLVPVYYNGSNWKIG